MDSFACGPRYRDAVARPTVCGEVEDASSAWKWPRQGKVLEVSVAEEDRAWRNVDRASTNTTERDGSKFRPGSILVCPLCPFQSRSLFASCFRATIEFARELLGLVEFGYRSSSPRNRGHSRNRAVSPPSQFGCRHRRIDSDTRSPNLRISRGSFSENRRHTEKLWRDEHFSHAKHLVRPGIERISTPPYVRSPRDVTRQKSIIRGNSATDLRASRSC